MAYIDSTTGSTNTDFPSTAVPAGPQADDIVILVATIDVAAAVFEVGDWPTGFIELGEVDLTGDGQSIAIGYKRLTGADAGSYTFGDLQNGTAGALNTIAQAYLFRGRHTTNPPEISTIAANNAANANPVSVTANGVTALDGDDLLMISAPDVRTGSIGNGHAAPTDYTEREDAENDWANLAGFTRDNVSAGATGNITSVFSITGATAGWAAILVRIPVAVAAAAKAKPIYQRKSYYWPSRRR